MKSLKRSTNTPLVPTDGNVPPILTLEITENDTIKLHKENKRLTEENKRLTEENEKLKNALSASGETLKLLHQRTKDALSEKEEVIARLFTLLKELKEKNAPITPIKRMLLKDILDRGRSNNPPAGSNPRHR